MTRACGRIAFLVMCAVAGIALGVLLVAWTFDWQPQPDGPASRAATSAQPPSPPAKDAMAPAGAWPMFRGNRALTGVAPGRVGQKLTLRWRFGTGAAVKSSPAVAGGRVFVGSDDQHVYCIDLAKGSRVWAYKTGDAVEAAPLVRAGAVFVGSADGFLYALDAAKGTLRWRYKTDDKILGAANWTTAPDGNQLRILVGSYDNKLYCVDAATGQPVWTYTSESFINGAPAVGGGMVVFGGCDANVHVVSADDGSRIALIDAGSYIAGSAALAGDYAFIGHFGGEMLCVDLAAGRFAWRYGEKELPVFSSAAVGADRIVFGGRDKRVHCVRRDSGEPIWAFPTLGKVDASPVICGDKVVAASADGRLYLLRLADGKKLWSYEIGEPIVGSPAVAGGVVVVGSEDGKIYAFESK